MEIEVQAAILHVLDTNASEPVLADVPLAADEESAKYLAGHLQRAFSSEEARDCCFNEGSPLSPVLAGASEGFVEATQTIAREWFRLMSQWVSIPAADVLFALAQVDGVPCLAALKLNYKAAWLHQSRLDSGVANLLVRQSSALPGPTGKADEAFFAALDGSVCRVIEKKYEIDGRKSAYLCAHLLGARSGYSSREKLEVVRAAAVEVNQQFYGSLGMDEPSVDAALLQLCETAETPPTAGEICQALYGEVPHARDAFEKALEEKAVDTAEPVAILPAAVRRMEHQKLKSYSGVEVKVPVELYKDTSAVEFIKNDDGSTSLLIKNILV